MTVTASAFPLARWAGRVAIVTGASSGSGAATARALAGIGMRTVLAARRLERLEQTARELVAQGHEAMAVRLDLADGASIGAMFDAVRAAWGGVDTVVHTAGVGYHGDVEGGNADEWQAMADINFVGFAKCLQASVAAVRERPEPVIVCVSSLSAHRINPAAGITVYGASKHAMRAVVDGLRGELAAKASPVKVGMISPGLIDSEMLESAMPADKFGLDTKDRTRFLDPADIADAVLWMLSTPPTVQIHDIIMRPIGQPT